MASETVVAISWLSRLKQSLGGVVVGFGIVVAMAVLLFWNEGRAVRVSQSLTHGAGEVITVNAQTVDPAHEGRLVYISGATAASGPAVDSQFGVSAAALVLRRKVEMYQWVERSQTVTESKLGGGQTQVTRYEYTPQWSAQRQDSAKFHEAGSHTNPAMTIEGATVYPGTTQLGARRLDAEVISQLGAAEPYALAPENAAGILRALPVGTRASIVEGKIYLTDDPAHPKVGDYRISYEYLPLQPISVVAAQRGETLGAYIGKSGVPLLIARRGHVPPEALFASAQAGNTTSTWIFRALGVAGLMAGFSTVLRPLSVAGSVIPLLGTVLNAGTGLVAAVLGVAVGTVTIAGAWVYYRPWLAAAIVMVGVLMMAALLWWLLRRRAAAPASAVVAPSVG